MNKPTDQQARELLSTLMSLAGISTKEAQDQTLKDLFSLADKEFFATLLMRLPPEKRIRFKQHAKRSKNPIRYLVKKLKKYYSPTKWKAIEQEKMTTVLIRFIKRLWKKCDLENKKKFIQEIEKYFDAPIEKIAKKQIKFLLW